MWLAALLERRQVGRSVEFDLSLTILIRSSYFLLSLSFIDLADNLTRHHEEDTPNSRRYQLTYG